MDVYSVSPVTGNAVTQEFEILESCHIELGCRDGSIRQGNIVRPFIERKSKVSLQFTVLFSNVEG